MDDDGTTSAPPPHGPDTAVEFGEIVMSTVEFEDLETTEHSRSRTVTSVALGKPTTVYQAAAMGALELLKEFIEIEGQDFIQADQWDATPLYYACLCGNMEIVQYLLERGATAAPDTFDGERCYYAAIDDDIRNLLKSYSAANKQRGPLFAYLFRIFNTPKFGRSDIVFHVVHDHTKIYAHKSILCSRSEYFAQQFRTKWKNRTEIRLTDTRMKGTALKTVIEYIYTERLVTTIALLPDVQILAKNLQLIGLQHYLHIIDVPTLVRKAEQSFASNRIMAKDLGPLYKTGSYPLFGLNTSSVPLSSNSGTDNMQYERDIKEWQSHKSSWFDSSLSVNSETKKILVENSLRVHFWYNLLRKGLVPEEVFLNHQACMDDEENGNLTDNTNNKHYPLSSNGAATTTDCTDLHHDLEFCIKGYTFRAHSAIVCGRSKFIESLVSFHSGIPQDTSGVIRTAYPLATSHDTNPSSSSSYTSSSSSSSSTVRTIPLYDVSPYVFGVLMEWMYGDIVRPFPTPALVHEAIVASDLFVLNDGIKPLLVARAIPHIQLSTVIPTLALGDVYNLHRLTVAAAGFVAMELETILQLPEFEELVRASAASITSRQEYDSVPVLDDIKTEIANIFGGKNNVYGVGHAKGVALGTEADTNSNIHTNSSLASSSSLTTDHTLTNQLLQDYARDADDIASQSTGRIVMRNDEDDDENDEQDQNYGTNGIDTVTTTTSYFDDRLQWDTNNRNSTNMNMDSATGTNGLLRPSLSSPISTIINERKNIDSQNNILKLVFTGRMQQNDVLAAVQQGLPPEGWKALSLQRMTNEIRTPFNINYGNGKYGENNEMIRRLKMVDDYAHSLGFKMRR